MSPLFHPSFQRPPNHRLGTHQLATRITIAVLPKFVFGIFLGPVSTPDVGRPSCPSRSSPRGLPWVTFATRVGPPCPSDAAPVLASVSVVHHPPPWSTVTVRFGSLSNVRLGSPSSLVAVYLFHQTP